jgi:hypothetical protein
MSEWKVSMDAIGITLLDSQDMATMQSSEKISKIVIAQRQLHQKEIIAMKHNRVLIGKKIVKVLDFFSFLNKLVSGLLCIKEIFKKMEATTCHLKNTPHMHDQFEMIPKGTKKIILDFTATSFSNCT